MRGDPPGPGGPIPGRPSSWVAPVQPGATVRRHGQTCEEAAQRAHARRHGEPEEASSGRRPSPGDSPTPARARSDRSGGRRTGRACTARSRAGPAPLRGDGHRATIAVGPHRRDRRRLHLPGRDQLQARRGPPPGRRRPPGRPPRTPAPRPGTSVERKATAAPAEAVSQGAALGEAPPDASSPGAHQVRTQQARTTGVPPGHEPAEIGFQFELVLTQPRTAPGTTASGIRGSDRFCAVTAAMGEDRHLVVEPRVPLLPPPRGGPNRGAPDCTHRAPGLEPAGSRRRTVLLQLLARVVWLQTINSRRLWDLPHRGPRPSVAAPAQRAPGRTRRPPRRVAPPSPSTPPGSTADSSSDPGLRQTTGTYPSHRPS